MKKFFLVFSIITGVFSLINTAGVYAQNVVQTDSIDEKVTIKKERNVLLNAGNNSGPREVNIGLPSSIGGTTIREDNMPVVYYYWPELPTKAWRASTSLASVGLLSINEATISIGDFGYAIDSYSRLGGQKSGVLGNVTGNNFGMFKTDVNVSGPIKNGWTYSLGVYTNYDPGTFDLDFTDYIDRTQMINLGVTKYFNNNRGKISFMYKYIHSATISNMAISRFEEGGEVEELDNFKIGSDSYIIKSGQLRFLDAITGEYYDVDMGNSDDMGSYSNTLTVLGDYKLGNGWNLDYTGRFRIAETKVNNYVPLSTFSSTSTDGFRDMNGNAYAGDVQVVMANHSNGASTSTFQLYSEANKKIGKHDLRVGMREQYYNQGEYAFNRSFFYQEVSASPRQLTNQGSTAGTSAVTDEYGFYNYNVGMGYNKGNENKISLYAVDKIDLSPRLDLLLGASIRYHNLGVDVITDDRGVGFTTEGHDIQHKTHDWLNLGANAALVYKVTEQFGLNGEFLYAENGPSVIDYVLGSANENETRSPYYSFGFFLNNPKINLVSQVTYLTRNNFQKNLNFVNPDNSSDITSLRTDYDIQTIGWTTDVITSPLENFNLHFRFTWQNPVYKNYEFSVYGEDYSYNDNNVTQLSKILIEIDPSVTMFKKKVRLWASARYFDRQYANLTNVLYYKGWWETFLGVNYFANKNVNFGVKFTNLLNQRGVKNEISGAELATSAEPYYGQTVVTSYIMPFTMEASVNFTF